MKTPLPGVFLWEVKFKLFSLLTYGSIQIFYSWGGFESSCVSGNLSISSRLSKSLLYSFHSIPL